MFEFQTRLRSMFGSIAALRLRQTRWTLSYWAWAFGLLPSSGKWGERISFVYIYLLAVGVMTPAILQLIGGLYLLEAQTAEALQVRILWITIPWIVAIIGVIFMVLPWKAWMLRLTFGDMTYLSPSPFDRRVLAVWRYLEMVGTIPLLVLLPLVLIAPMFGSIWARDVIPAVLRGALAIGLWSAPLLAMGWHLSIQDYVHKPPPVGVRWIARLSLIVIVGVLIVAAPDILLWPGRLIVLLAMGQLAWGWLLLAAYALLSVIIIWVIARHLSLTRASAGSDVFARIQQLGVMVLVDRRLLLSILGEARANESRAVGTLPKTRGIPTIYARAALYYRRQFGQAIQLVLVGLALGFGMILWRPFNLVTVIITVVLLTMVLPPWLASIFRNDVSVPFISQFIPQPATQRILAASLVPCLLVMVGLLPVMLVLNGLLPGWAWGLAPIVWVMSLVGHVEAIGKRSALGDRSIVTVLLGSAAVFAVVWSATTSSTVGIEALLPGILIAATVSFVLVLFAEIRHTGIVA
ncbi:MAG: hypothetical protein ABI947_18375 [Chloroflexota bacterium]